MPKVGTSNINRTQALATIHHGAAPGTGTDFVTNFSVGSEITALRVTTCFSTATVLTVMQDDGSNENAMALNKGAALTANAVETFTFGVRRTADGTDDGTLLVYNFQIATDSVIETFMVEGITGGSM